MLPAEGGKKKKKRRNFFKWNLETNSAFYKLIDSKNFSAFCSVILVDGTFFYSTTLAV